ncbi:uncharacterized protein A4U43_C05F35430 [Asparagus officinalis]|uniref:Uncharacterized protein n=2 Tax=Asparagus officinalis TaxID=4686 RepID=A0A5P1F1E2_ASPOF|nr:uncharacterized protein A4U43_C05F35430 [Asparagus officinalis]
MPFQVHGVGHRIEMVKGELPVVFDHPFVFDMFRDAEMKSYGTIMNSFYELEPLYVDFLRATRKLWCVGPVGFGDNQQVEKIKKWLDSKDPDSVIYVCFGSECTVSAYQINEMARGLEASGHPFIWVLRIDDIVLPSGFEARMEMGESKGLVLRGWAPQAMILRHPSVGGFMTHCGWNSILEGVSAGLPMAAWPLQSEQFINEKMVVEVLEIGVKVLRAVGDVVDEEIVRKSVELLMGGEQQSLEMRMRAKEYQAKARAVMEKGGASYEDLSHLIEEMEEYAKKRKMGGG